MVTLSNFSVSLLGFSAFSGMGKTALSSDYLIIHIMVL